MMRSIYVPIPIFISHEFFVLVSGHWRIAAKSNTKGRK